MGKAKKKSRFKRLQWRSVTVRDISFLAIGLGVALLGVYMTRFAKPHTTALAFTTQGITAPWIPQSVRQWEPLIIQMGRRYNLDPTFIAIIMTIESGGNPKAQSTVGAQGLMQVMPVTAQDIAAKHLQQAVASYDIYDPKTNIEFGTAYLAWLRDGFGQATQGPSWNTTAELVAAGYNGGPGAASNLEKGLGIESSETLAYSRDVLNMWRERAATTSPTYARWHDRGGSRLVSSP